jgi:hypothetical protein
MRNLLTVLALFAGSSAFAMPGPLINGNQINPTSAISISTLTVTGAQGLSVTGQATIGSSVTIQGAASIAGAASVAGTLTATGASGASVTYRVSAGSVTVGTTDLVTDAANHRVGIATASPATTLDVSGTSQFGTTAKSTFSTTGALTLASGAALTVSGANGNIIGSSSFTTTGGGFFGSLRDSGIASGTQCIQADSSGNLTGTGSSCASTSGFAALATTNTWSASQTFGAAGITTMTFNAGFVASNTSTFTVNSASASFNNGLTVNGAFSSPSASTATFAGDVQNTSLSIATETWSSGQITGSSTTAACVPGSTRTFTLNGTHRLRIELTATINSISSGSDGAFVLIDGAAPDSFFSASGRLQVWSENNAASNNYVSLSVPYETNQTYSPGVHNACVVIILNGAAQHMQCDSGPCTLKVGPSIW